MRISLFSQLMEIAQRNKDLVARHVKGETLAAIAKTLDISRERARQIWSATATKTDHDELAATTKAQKKAPQVKSSPDFPKGETRVRLNIPFARNSDISQRQIRAGLARWLSGEIQIPLDARGAQRFGPVIASSMNDRLAAKCDIEGISITTAVRGVIAYLEKEQAK